MTTTSDVPKEYEGQTATGEVLAGISLGIFVGIMLGMSVTPLVATVMGAFVAVLATFFGMADTASTAVIRPAFRRITAFCLAAAIATLGAVYLRTHDMLSATPEPRETMQSLATELKAVGFSPEEARALIKLRFFDGSATGDNTGTQIAAAQSTAQDSVLFGFTGSVSDCATFARYQASPVDQKLVAFKTTDGALSSLAARVEELPATQRDEALKAGRFLLCGY